VKGLLLSQEELKGENDDKNKSKTKVKTENEVMALCYLNYLETNNYLKTDQKYLFGDLVQSTSKPVHQE
jgi:hypothetical protein